MPATSLYPPIPKARLVSPGDSATGRIVDFEDYQVKDRDTGLKFSPSGEPVMGVRIVLETISRERLALWVGDPSMLRAVAKRVKAAGRSDLALGDYLSVTLLSDPEKPYGVLYSKAK